MMGGYRAGVGTHGQPPDVAVTLNGALAVVADNGNHCIRYTKLNSAETRPLAGVCKSPS